MCVYLRLGNPEMVLVIFAEKGKEQWPRTIISSLQKLKFCTIYFSILNIINLTYKETHLSLIYQYQGVVENTIRGHCFEH